ncbi:tetratricopeptide repeat protein [Kribbella sp. NPDC051770]|uniref:tetratricopeptide repeat protein n=1 Tax=Kribbella sp. NPDC051770 TaxID=3155413 RepID=UPI00342838C8
MDPRAGFAQLLRGFRARSALTQEGLAELAGLSVQAINALEGGRRLYPRPATVGRLVEALRLDDEEHSQLAAAAHRPAAAKVAVGGPRELPPPVTDFIGRSEQLGALLRLLRSPRAAAPGIVISSIGGMAGIGKTTLAVHAAHQVVSEFPDGQLYLNLRGGGDKPLTTAEALDALLLALGLPTAGPSEQVQATAARYRTALAGRQILLVLDDVASVEQVTLLMPGTPGAVVVITSRHTLAALPGARHLALEVLTETEAVQLLEEAIGTTTGWDRDAALEIVRKCGLLPLAIRIAGGRARTNGLREVAATLSAERGRSEMLTAPQAEVGRSIGLSLSHLAGGPPVDAAAAQAFAVLALFDGEHFPLRAAAKVLDVSLDDAEDLLERLVDVHLLETPAIHQYSMHDLVREAGRAIAAAELPEPMRAEARQRELKCYLSVLWRWNELRGRDAQYGSRTGVPWSEGAGDLDDVDQVEAWLRPELPNLVGLVRSAAIGTPDERLIAVRLALGMPQLAVSLMRFEEARSAMLAVTAIAEVLPPALEFGRYYQAGFVCGCLALYDESEPWLRKALPIARRSGTPTDLAICLIDLGYGLGCAGRPAEGLPYAEEALAVVVEHGVTKFEVGANVGLGALAGLAGDLKRQRTAFDRALTLMPERSLPIPAAVHTNMIGRSYRESGQYDDSIKILRGNLDSVQRLDRDVVEADTLEELGHTLLAAGDFTAAEPVLRAGLEIAARHPAENREAPALHLLGRTLVALDRTAEAVPLWERSIQLYERLGDPRSEEVRKLLSEVE